MPYIGPDGNVGGKKSWWKTITDFFDSTFIGGSIIMYRSARWFNWIHVHVLLCLIYFHSQLRDAGVVVAVVVVLVLFLLFSIIRKNYVYSFAIWMDW
jgi:hypothetical protein